MCNDTNVRFVAITVGNRTEKKGNPEKNDDYL
jgi:hypothetical protein